MLTSSGTFEKGAVNREKRCWMRWATCSYYQWSEGSPECADYAVFFRPNIDKTKRPLVTFPCKPSVPCSSRFPGMLIISLLVQSLAVLSHVLTFACRPGLPLSQARRSDENRDVAMPRRQRQASLSSLWYARGRKGLETRPAKVWPLA